MLEVEVDVHGCCVYWHAAQRVDLSKLIAELRLVGRDQHAPQVREPLTILGDALRGVFKEREALVRPLENAALGWAVVREDRGQQANSYTDLAVCRLPAAGTLAHGGNLAYSEASTCTWAFQHRESRVRSEFDSRCDDVTTAAVTRLLTSTIERVQGTRLRRTGAVYWVPVDGLAEWNVIVGAVESAGAASVYGIRTAKDADTLRAVRDGLVGAVTKACQDAMSQLERNEEGEPLLGELALQNRADLASQLAAKVKYYEYILSEPLAELEGMCTALRQKAAAEALEAAAVAERRRIASGKRKGLGEQSYAFEF